MVNRGILSLPKHVYLLVFSITSYRHRVLITQVDIPEYFIQTFRAGQVMDRILQPRGRPYLLSTILVVEGDGFVVCHCFATKDIQGTAYGSIKFSLSMF